MRGLHWFRNDLRRQDNRALSELCSRCDELAFVFVLDERLLEEREGTPRHRFLCDALQRLGEELKERDQRLLLLAGRPEEVLPRVCAAWKIELVGWNEDTTPFAKQRDEEVRRALEREDVRVVTRHDRVLYGADHVRTRDDKPYSVYTPFRNAWRERLAEEGLEVLRAPHLPARVPGAKGETLAAPPPDDSLDLPTAGHEAARARLSRFLDGTVGAYASDRNRPDRDGTSRLSPYLRLGAISVRQCIASAREAADQDSRLSDGVEKWIDELAWRDFYAAILDSHPHVLQRSFRPEFDAISWEDDEAGFEAWCEGRTGYPLVDAGMRQLRATGWMHNRVRMVVASFLTKDLLIDWRRGERFFDRWLVDGDPASNNGGWQWAASTGTDPQPWFRIFNPVSQGTRWDPDGDYVRRWVPELGGLEGASVHEPWESPMLAREYPDRIVDHASRREEALQRYEAAREEAGS